MGGGSGDSQASRGWHSSPAGGRDVRHNCQPCHRHHHLQGMEGGGVRNEPLCVSPRCKRDSETGTFLARPAAAGLRLCGICVKRLGENILTCTVRYRELGLVLTATGGGGNQERTTGGDKNPNM